MKIFKEYCEFKLVKTN